MKKAFLIPGVLLAIALMGAFSHVPRDPGPGHLASRYLNDSPAETRIPSPVLAVEGDYRSLDLLVGALLFGAGVLVLSILSGKSRPTLARLLAASGTALALGLGLVSLVGGGNFLDHETLARWVDPLEARWKGALWLAWAYGLAFLGSGLSFLREEGDRHGT